jgi:transcriptional regulator with XRE-family HTH domain
MRGAAKEIGLSGTTVNHVENGRMDLNDKLIGRFVKAYGYTLGQYNDYLKGKESIPFNHKEECISLIKSMDNSKLRAIHGLLSNF